MGQGPADRTQADPPPFEFRFVEAPEPLAPYTNALTVFRSSLPELSDIMPSFSPQLMLFGEGTVRITYAGGGAKAPAEAFFVSQLDEALPFTVEGPAVAIGASLNVLGWAALTRLPVGELRNRAIGVRAVLNTGLAGRIEELRAGLDRDADLDAAVRDLAAILADGLMPVPDAEKAFISTMRDWLSDKFDPDVAILREKVALSERQLQRLSSRYFGGAPSAIAKRYRAVRAATLLSMPDLSQDVAEEIFDAYYDQAHLIRDLRRYTGRTPQLLKARDEPSLAGETLDLDGYGDRSLMEEILRTDTN